MDALNWQWDFEDVGTSPWHYVPTTDRQPRKTASVLYSDEHMTYALTVEGIFWLYRSEESEKARHMGG